MAVAFTVPSVTSALADTEPTTVDDRAIDSSVENVPERKSVEFNQPSASSGESTSGYMDKNGKPVSYDEFLKIRAENSKGVFEKYPIPSALVVIAIIGGIYYLIRRRKAVKK